MHALRRPLLKILVIAVCSLVVTSSARAAYVLTEVARPGAAMTALWDINNSGTMVGYSSIGDTASAFVYDGTSFTTLSGPLGSTSSFALGISDTGKVVGSYLTAPLGSSHGFIYSSGIYTPFDIPGANETFLRGISPDGRYISGYYSNATQTGVGFVYDTLLGTLADLSAPDSVFTIPQGINGAGIVVGSDILSGPPVTRPGFLYDIATGVRVDQSIAGATRTALRSIDDSGVLAGWFVDSAGQHGFVGSLSSFEQIDFPGAEATTVEGSNNAGFLVGLFFIGDTNHAFIATPVSEPSTWGLFAVGLGVLAWARSRRSG